VSVALLADRATSARRAYLGCAGDLASEERAHLRAKWYALSVRKPHHIVARHVSGQTHPPPPEDAETA
jgi:hypothetical protein